MTTLSVCLIMKNEENNLERCLSSIKNIAGEIIVVDTGSTDNSLQIAYKLGAQVFFYEWKNDFSSARNYSLDKASSEWILVLDGDEELDSKCLELLKNLIQSPDTDAYLLTISQPSKNKRELLATASLQLRLFRNNKNYRYRGVIREQILDSILDHKPSALIKTASDITIIHWGCTPDGNVQHRLKRNVELINQVLEQEEEQPFKYYLLGQEYYHRYRFLEALEYFRLAYDSSDSEAPYIPELVRSIAASLYMQDKASEALAFVDEAQSIRGNSADLYYLQGIIYKNLGLYAQAYKSIKKALLLFPPPPYRDILYYHSKYSSLYLLGGLSEYFMDMDGALSYYYESLKNNPYLLDSLRRMINILQPRKNPDYTVDSLNRIFDLSARNLQAELAQIFYNERAYQLSLDCINQLESYGQTSEKIRLLKGLSLMRVKKYSEAEEVLQSITQDKDIYIEARQYLLLYYWMIKDYPTTVKYLRQIKTAEAEPSAVYVLNLLTGNPASKTNLIPEQAYKQARELMSMLVELGDYDQVNEAFYNLTPVLGKRPSYMLAELFYNCEKYELAKVEFLSLLTKGHDYPQCFYYLGKICWILGDLDAAHHYLQQTIKKGLDTPRIRREKARLHQELAIKTLKEGLDHLPDEVGWMKQIQELEESLLEV